MSQAALESYRSIRPQNAGRASLWSRGAQNYDEISRGTRDAIEHCIKMLEPRAGDLILDLAAGTGWTARCLAQCGFRVTAVDLAPEMLAAGAKLAAEKNLSIAFELGDAEALPYPESEFDSVISTFGVIFAGQPEDAAIELARIIRPGGRMALTVWAQDSTMHELCKVLNPFAMTPEFGGAPAFSVWGEPERIQALLSADFDLSFERGISYYSEASAQSSWSTFYQGYGPLRTLADRLNDACREELMQRWIEFHNQFRTASGIRMPRDYWIVRGTRR